MAGEVGGIRLQEQRHRAGQTERVHFDGYVEAVLAVVEQVPAGRVTSYGTIAEYLGAAGPRQVGAVLAAYGAAVPWWRVVRADGTLPDRHRAQAHARYREEGTPLHDRSRHPRVDMARAHWEPAPPRQP